MTTYIISYHIIYYIILYYIILYYIILYYIILYYIILYYIILYYIILYYIHFAMSSRSYSCVEIYVCHQQMALEQIHRNIRTSDFHWTLHIRVLRNKNYISRCIRIASTESLSFSIITFSVLLTNSRVLLL